MIEQQIEAMRENIANLQTSLSLQLDITKTMLEAKEAMLKHIADLEAALKKAVEMWDEETPLFDFELMITGVKEQFAYLFYLDDGYEPQND